MKDNQMYKLDVDLPKGQPGNPMSDEEIEAKFSNMATKLMPQAQVQKIIDTVLKLDELNDVSTLTKLLAVPRS
jgi:2-methylcitrate dehydratase